MHKRVIITLDPGETLEVRGAYDDYETTDLYLVSWNVEEGWATTTCHEMSDDSGYHSLVNNWELPPETS